MKRKLHSVTILLKKLIALFLFGLVITTEPLWAQNNSVLATGSWLKFSVMNDGVYKIDYNQLRSAGINPDGINPKQIKIFTGYNAMLPQENNSPISGELQEVPIFIAGEGDDRFNSNDYILFFAQGPDHAELISSKKIHAYENNLFADKNFFFLTVAQDNGKRVSDSENIAGTFPLIQTFNDFAYYETEKYNILKSGRQWFGEQFDATTEATVRFDLSGIVENSEMKFVSQVMGQSIADCSFQALINSNPVVTQPIAAIPNTSYGIKGRIKTDTVTLNSSAVGASSKSTLDVTYKFTKGGSGLSVGYLDFFLLSFQRKLSLYGDQTIFQSAESLANAISTYEITNAVSGVKVWNITDMRDVKNQVISLAGSKASFSTNTSTLQKFIVFAPEKSNTPVFEGAIVNQNLSKLTPPSLLIITNFTLAAEAKRLADHRQNHSGITAKVITLDQIYNEYASGKQDVSAIRNFIRAQYSQPSSSLKNVLLFGRGSYDYKNRVLANTNIVPIYESRNSLSPLETYSSDDYYGFLEGTEGRWSEGLSAENHTLEIGIGRLPVKNITEAQTVVDKLIEYDLKMTTPGAWQSEFLFVGDDGDFNIHQNQADQLANSIEQYEPAFHARKLYVDSFEQIEKNSGQLSPDAQRALDLEIRKGALIVNFTGHGSERVWMDERILDDTFVQSWKQAPKYPLFITATCEFGRNDDPFLVSSAELTLLQKKGGSIGIVTTARPVNASTNFTLNKAFYESFFIKESNQFRELGSIFRDTKNKSMSGVSNRNFSLLGDPSMKLALPTNSIIVDEIKTSTGATDLQALSKVIVKGHIEKNSQTNTNFNGTLTLTFCDGEKDRVTKGDENPPFYYSERYNVLFRGNAEVTQGIFESEFVIPKSSPSVFTIGKIGMYAFSENKEYAAGGAYKNLVGTIDPAAAADNTPPIIRLFMGDTTFINGGTVGPNTKIVALLSDESGINISALPEGNSIVAQLDDNAAITINDYYLADLSTYKKGRLSFPLDNLEKGKHTLTLSVSDTYNNRSTTQIDFVVTDGVQIQIEEFINYPNPFYESTTIEFTHSRPGEDLEAIMTIFDMSGRVLLTQQYEIPSSQYRVTLAEWDGKEANGTKLSRGIYVSKLSVRSLLDGSKNEQFTKLIIVN